MERTKQSIRYMSVELLDWNKLSSGFEASFKTIESSWDKFVVKYNTQPNSLRYSLIRLLLQSFPEIRITHQTIHTDGRLNNYEISPLNIYHFDWKLLLLQCGVIMFQNKMEPV